MSKNLFKEINGCAQYLREREDLNAKKDNSDTCINDTFNEVCELLDDDFECHFPGEFDARCWELCIASQLKKSLAQCQEPLRVEKGEKKKNSGGPDFKLTVPHHAMTIYIECVCPQKASQDTVKGGDFTFNEEVDKDKRHSSATWSGIDHASVLRFTSALLNKSSAYQQYVDRDIIKQTSFKIVCVSGFAIGQDKAKRYCPASPFHTLSVKEDFAAALYGESNYSFGHDASPVKRHMHPFSATKNEKRTIQVGFQPYLAMFDALIFFEKSPADYLCREKHYRIYYNSKEKERTLAPYLSLIFPSR
ncbi:MAG: hypothetical protein IT497_10845 [Ottowia sp.]|nr:hypothetical protein [Ottowia sp.]